MPHAIPLVSYASQSRGPVLSGMMLDNGLALMAAHLARRGYAPAVLDYNSLRAVEGIAALGHEGYLDRVVEELCDHVARTGARMIGFKLYLNGFHASLRIASRLRARFPKLFVVGGGPQIDWFMESIFDVARRAVGDPVFDALVYGDADIALPMLADSVHGGGEGLASIPNLILPEGPGGRPRRTPRRYYDLRELPLPEYDPAVYDTTGKLLIPVVEDSRSCDTACTFCVQPRIGGRRRERAVEAVLGEIEHYRTRYGYRLFRLAGPKPTARYLGELVRGMHPSSRFSAFGYADQAYDDVIASGKLVGLFTGLESTDPRILSKVYNKTEDPGGYLRSAAAMIAAFKARGLVNVVSMIVPSPHETEASIQRSIEFLGEANPDFVPCLPVCPMPGTPLTRLARTSPDAAGVRLDDDYEHHLAAFETDLLRPPSTWPAPPWQVKVGDAWVRNAFAEVTAPFAAELEMRGMHILSDEQVLMAYLHDNGLSSNQAERRRQCLDLNATARRAIEAGDAAALRGIVDRVNEHQTSTPAERASAA